MSPSKGRRTYDHHLFVLHMCVKYTDFMMLKCHINKPAPFVSFGAIVSAKLYTLNPEVMRS